jgi:hypothetical protein
MSSDQHHTPPPSKPLANRLGETPDGQIIYQYTRAQTLADGMQVDVSQTAREAGIRFPTFLTRGVFDHCVAVPKGVTGQDEAGRLWDVLWMLRVAIQKSKDNPDRLPFQLFVRNTNTRPKLTTLFASCGPVDIDDPEPAITILLPGED